MKGDTFSIVSFEEIGSLDFCRYRLRFKVLSCAFPRDGFENNLKVSNRFFVILK